MGWGGGEKVRPGMRVVWACCVKGEVSRQGCLRYEEGKVEEGGVNVDDGRIRRTSLTVGLLPREEEEEEFWILSFEF